MKYLALSVSLLAAACQPQAKPATTTLAKPAVTVVAAQRAPAVETEAPAPLADTVAMHLSPLAPPVRDVAAFLAANNLAPLWQADFNPDGESHVRPTILDGFYGPEHRHIAFIIDQAQQDSIQPQLFRVRGRTRYRKSITPFEGTITVQAVKPMRVFLDLDSAAEAQARAYSATARFVLREDTSTTGAGTYQGSALLDFYRLPSGRLDFARAFPDPQLPTGGGGLLFRGQWQSRRTGGRKPVAFAYYPQAVLPNTMADLYIGDRGENINPKYAGLDWNSIWENDEWWAKSPKPTLSL